MTILYNAAWYSCFLNFLESLKKDGIDYCSLEKSERDAIRIAHKKFYEDVKNNIKSEFYELKSPDFKMFKYSKWVVVDVRDYKINYGKKRAKYRNTLYMINDDEKSTQNALEANNMHYLDALLVRHIINKFDVLTIHDCFGVRLSELHLLMDEVNLYYSNIVGEDTYCMHIII